MHDLPPAGGELPARGHAARHRTADVDGKAVGCSVRAQPCGAAVVMVAMTGWRQTRTARGAVARFDRHLTEPMECDALSALLEASEVALSEVERSDALAAN